MKTGAVNLLAILVMPLSNESKSVPFGERPIWQDTHLQETKGGRYRNNESFAVNDIYQAGHSRCHLDVLEQYKIRAYVLAPIFSGSKLWGVDRRLSTFRPTPVG